MGKKTVIALSVFSGIILLLMSVPSYAEPISLEQLEGVWINAELLKPNATETYKTQISSAEFNSFYMLAHDRKENIWWFGTPQPGGYFNISKAEITAKDTVGIYPSRKDTNGQPFAEFKITSREGQKITRLARVIKTETGHKELIYVPIPAGLSAALLPTAGSWITETVRPLMGGWVRKDLTETIKEHKSVYKARNYRDEPVFHILRTLPEHSTPHVFFNWFHEANSVPIIDVKINKDGTEYVLIYPEGREVITVLGPSAIKRQIEWGHNYGMEGIYIRYFSGDYDWHDQYWKQYLNKLIFATQCDKSYSCSTTYKDEFGQLYVFQNDTVQMPEGVFRYHILDDFVFYKDADYLILENRKLDNRTEASDFAPDQCPYAAFEYKNGKFLLYRTTYVEPSCEKRELFRTLTPLN